MAANGRAFSADFEAMTGCPPFPWQEKLLLDWFLRGRIPPAIDIPTGLGKTAVMAIWVFARAAGASLPRRLVYVVDRRAVVDQATEVALSLRQFVDSSAELKRRLGLDDHKSLPVSTLRGQLVDNNEWLEDPASHAIIVGTVDMVGSRLLFEGYRVSRKMRPYHAGLLGADTLVVLDEAHLVPPFEQLLRAVAEDVALRPREQELRAIIPPFKVLPLSATGRNSDVTAFGLTGKDFEHNVVKKRLNAKKHLRIEPLSKDEKLEEALAKHAWDFSSQGTSAIRCVVFCDQREVAVKAKHVIEQLAKGDKKAAIPTREISTELLVGSRRVFEREMVKERLKALGFIADSKVERDRPTFLFATSAGEVGIDLDADHMVCDLVAWERMVQRLGRVNRRGEPEHRVSRIEVMAEPEPKDFGKIIEKEVNKRTKKDAEVVARVQRMKATKRLFEQLPSVDDGGVDVSPGSLQRLKENAEADPDLRKLLDAATTPAPLRPALSRALVDAWSMTSVTEHTGRPAINPWLRGWVENEPPQTAIVWRTHLPVSSGGISAVPREIERFFEAAPPHTSEILETETFRVVEWLTSRANALIEQSPEQSAEDNVAGKGPAPQDVVAFVLNRDGDLCRHLRLDFFDSANKAAAKKRREELENLFAEATLVVDARLGGLMSGLLDENNAGAPRTLDDGQEWLGEGVVRFRVRSVDAGGTRRSDGQWYERLRFATEVSGDGEPRRWLIVDKWRHDAATEEDRSAGRPQLLDEHQSWVESKARALAKALSLDDYVEMLAVSARFHDEGKRAKRWQRSFNAPADAAYAKTEGPINYSLLDGYRHELGSLLYVEKNARLLALPDDQRELALHLIAAHHGFARAAIGTDGCEDAPPSKLKERAREIALRFARLEDRWGPWGLAWWESLLRAADQQASRDNDARILEYA
jgi:CRISPR-associated endonuclease/helicase Cas3